MGGSASRVGESSLTEGRSALELRGLVKRYGTTTDLDGLSLGVERGQMIGFVGSNGAGKTTMRVITGVLAPDEGEVLRRPVPRVSMEV